jgi:hypothetical protein
MDKIHALEKFADFPDSCLEHKLVVDLFSMNEGIKQ